MAPDGQMQVLSKPLSWDLNPHLSARVAGRQELDSICCQLWFSRRGLP